MRYTLMHRDVEAASLDIVDESGYISKIQSVDARHMPVGSVLENGSVDGNSLRDWWSNRSIPATRQGLHRFLESLDIPDTSILLTKSMGLSLSDQYWIRPKDSDIRWSDVNFFDNAFSEDVGDLLFGDLTESGCIDLSSPDNTSDGNLRKRWKIVDGRRCLIKAGTGSVMQEPFNEAIASAIMKSQDIDHVEYGLYWHDGDPCSICEDFIDRNTELVTAYYVNKTSKRRNGSTTYDHYVNCCSSFGLDIVPSLDRMIVVDYLMLNTDRHLNNFGIVRDASTLEWLKPAPIYDTGTSLLNDTVTEMIEKDVNPECRPFGRRLDDEIDLVRSFDWIDFPALEECLDEAERIMSTPGSRISAERREALMGLLSQRIDNLRFFARSR